MAADVIAGEGFTALAVPDEVAGKPDDEDDDDELIEILEVAVVLELKPISNALTADRKRAMVNISDGFQASQKERMTGRNERRLCNIDMLEKRGNECS